jgi:hypothetical protein
MDRGPSVRPGQDSEYECSCDAINAGSGAGSIGSLALGTTSRKRRRDNDDLLEAASAWGRPRLTRLRTSSIWSQLHPIAFTTMMRGQTV